MLCCLREPREIFKCVEDHKSSRIVMGRCQLSCFCFSCSVLFPGFLDFQCFLGLGNLCFLFYSFMLMLSCELGGGQL